MECAGHVRLSCEGIVIAKVEKTVVIRSITELDHVSSWLRSMEFSRGCAGFAHLSKDSSAVAKVEIVVTTRRLTKLDNVSSWLRLKDFGG